MKTNTKIQRFSYRNRNVFAKTTEKTFEFYLEVTFNLEKKFFILQFFLNSSWTPL